MHITKSSDKLSPLIIKLRKKQKTASSMIVPTKDLFKRLAKPVTIPEEPVITPDKEENDDDGFPPDPDQIPDPDQNPNQNPTRTDPCDVP